MTAKPFVFSIRGKYVREILAGRKREEYRVSNSSMVPGERWLVYETSPACRVVASVRMTRILSGEPAEVWAFTSRRGVSRADYDKYFKGRPVAYAIGFEDVQPLDLALPEGMRAPMSRARWSGPWPVAGVPS